MPTARAAAVEYLAAAVQFEPTIFDKAGNLERLEALVAEAAEAGARLVVLPEMATTGYVFTGREEIKDLVEPLPGPTTKFLAGLAARHRVHLVAGLAEVDPTTDFYYNSAVLVGPDGGLAGRYRKLHSFINETAWAKDGDLGPIVIPTELGRIGLLICNDANFFEAARLEALAGADLIAFPTNWLGPAPSRKWRARALENGVYLVSANRWGTERGARFAGGSCVIDPLGGLVGVRETGDGVVLGRISLELARHKALEGVGDRLTIRRPGEYHRLVIHSHLWHHRHTFGRLSTGKPLVGVVQVGGDDALAAVRRMLGEAVAGPGTDRAPDPLPAPDLVVLPDLSGVAPAEALPTGPVFQEVLALARRHGTFIVYGAREVDGGRRFRTAILVGPDGLLGRYRSIHVTPGDRLDPGDLGFPGFDLPFGRVGLLLGADLYVPEAARCLAKIGVDLICVSAALTRPEAESHILAEDRATTDHVYLAMANLTGLGPGSAIYAHAEAEQPSPEVHLPPEGDGYGQISLEIADDSPVRQKEYLRKLQPFWYTPLVRPGSPGRGGRES
ncbi:MAG TPA: nitrilase-related carbon-nitrogen hydrolase [Bacillota bacterium]|jgi:predicted amidohydrolase